MNVYEIVTERIIKKMEEGVIPWRKPWSGGRLPLNMATGKAYRGLNVWTLGMADYGSPYWMTLKQANDLGGGIKAGSKSTPVIFWKVLEKANPAKDKGDKAGKDFIPMIRYYNVFNFEQTRGIKNPEPLTANPFTPIERAEEVLKTAPMPEVKAAGKAYYSPSLDYIGMPDKARFDKAEFYYSVLFHEMTHATGHAKRLNRAGITDAGASFGSEVYSKEELVAEMGAAFLCQNTGIENITLENSVAYLQGWLGRLREDSKLLITAAAQAQKATDYLLGVKPQEKSGAVEA